jgi:hypothetical protein
LRAVVENRASRTLALFIVDDASAAIKKREERDALVHDPDVGHALIASWLATMESTKEGLAALENEPTAIWILQKWSQHGGEAEVKRLLREWVDDDEGLRRVANLVLPGFSFSRAEQLFDNLPALLERCTELGIEGGFVTSLTEAASRLESEQNTSGSSDV